MYRVASRVVIGHGQHRCGGQSMESNYVIRGGFSHVKQSIYINKRIFGLERT